MYEEIMTNDDNLESNLQTSILLKILVQAVLHVEPEVCEEVRGDWRVTAIYTTIVNCYKCHRFYWLSQFTWKYNGLLIKSHKSRCGRSGV